MLHLYNVKGKNLLILRGAVLVVQKHKKQTKEAGKDKEKSGLKM